jgi:hypothetical protein
MPRLMLKKTIYFQTQIENLGYDYHFVEYE